MTMPNHIARLYVLVAMLAVFFFLWANIAVHPWTSRAAAPPSTPATQTVRVGDDGELVRAAAPQPAASVVASQPVTHTRTS